MILCNRPVNRDKVYNIARRFVGNHADAEDVTQEVMMLVLNKGNDFRGDSSFNTWVHKVTVNAALAYRLKNRPRVFEVREEFELPAEIPLQQQETSAFITNAINRLPTIYRLPYVMSDVDELPNEVICEKLGITLSAVKSRLHRARMMMRTILMPYKDGL